MMNITMRMTAILMMMLMMIMMIMMFMVYDEDYDYEEGPSL